MATQYPLPITVAQMGTYFVQQYYKLLEQQPEFVYNFYTDVSTMVRIDGNTPETATGMMQIRSLIMSLNCIGVEIKTAHSLESWSGGILVLVAGSVQIRNVGVKRKFTQILFLAPQEDGFFVLNDIIHLDDAEAVHLPQPEVFLPQSRLDSKLNATNIISEPVTNYLMIGEIETRANLRQHSEADKFNFSEQLLQPISQIEDILEEDSVEDSNVALQNTVNNGQASPPARVDEPVREPQKHTYASILRVAKGQPAPSTAPQPSPNKKMAPVLERHHIPQGPQQNGQHAYSTTVERSISEDVSTIEDEGELKSVYIKNLLPNVSPSEIEEQFKRFGKIKPDGVVIRSRKDLDVCYAFVEFEDTTGVQNAIKVSTVEIAGRPVYIEERRASNNNSSRGGRRGRGRGSYITHAPRGRFGAHYYGRGSGQDGNDRDYRPRATSETGQDGNDREYRSRGASGTDQDGSGRDYRPRATNGFHRQVSRQNRGFTGNYVSRSGQNPLESTA